MGTCPCYQKRIPNCHKIMQYQFLSLVENPSENIGQLGLLFPIYGENMFQTTNQIVSRVLRFHLSPCCSSVSLVTPALAKGQLGSVDSRQRRQHRSHQAVAGSWNVQSFRGLSETSRLLQWPGILTSANPLWINHKIDSMLKLSGSLSSACELWLNEPASQKGPGNSEISPAS